MANCEWCVADTDQNRPAVNGRGYDGGAPSMGLVMRTRTTLRQPRSRGFCLHSPTASAWGGLRQPNLRYSSAIPEIVRLQACGGVRPTPSADPADRPRPMAWDGRKRTINGETVNN
jgi:hypothetical protein